MPPGVESEATASARDRGSAQKRSWLAIRLTLLLLSLTMGCDRPIPGTKMNIGRMSKRTLESWAHYYGIRHLADGVPLTRKAMVYQRMLTDIQR